MGFIMPSETSIALSLETKQKLENIKVHPRETMDDIIIRLLDLHNKQEKEKNH